MLRNRPANKGIFIFDFPLVDQVITAKIFDITIRMFLFKLGP